MIASLPMYDMAPQRAANDRFWALIRKALGQGPEALTRSDDLWTQWRAPDLLLSQTCGYPYRAKLHGVVTLVGTPDYGLPGCGPGEYASVFVARRDDGRALPDFADAVFAYNEPLSQSGWAAPLTHAASLGFVFSDTLQTGGHRLSALAVHQGRADLAAIDALTWEMLCAHEGFAQDLREVARTAPTPALPFITARGQDPAPLFAAIETAIDKLGAQDRAALHLCGLIHVPAQAYLDVPNPPPPPK